MADIPYRVVIATAKALFKVGGVPIDMTGTENVPATGGAVIACNHNSYLDFILAGYPGERQGRFTRFMAKQEVFDNSVSGPLMRSLKHLSVDRANGAAALQVAIEACQRGEVVGVYPEATISRSFQIKDIKTGAVRIASEAGVPIVPVVHFGAHRWQTKDRPRDLSRGKPVVIRTGEAWRPEGVDAIAESGELKRRMADLLDECIADYPGKEPGAWWLPHTHGGSAPTLAEAEEMDREEKRLRAERKAAKAKD